MPGSVTAAVVSLTVLAFALRLYRLGAEPLWFDEAYTALTAVEPVATIFARLQAEGNGPLYYLLLHVWTAWFGDGEWVLRLPSAVIGAATIPMVFGVGAQLFSPRAGVIAAALATVSPLQIYYSQEVRMYCLVPPLALLLVAGLHRLLLAPTIGAFAMFVVPATAGLYVHYYFLFLLPLAGLALVVPERRQVVSILVVAILAVVVGFGPWWPTFFRQAGGGVQDWVAEWWRTRPFWYAVPWSLEVLGPSAQYPSMSNFKFPSSLVGRVGSLACAALVLGGAGAAVLAVRRRRTSASPLPALSRGEGRGEGSRELLPWLLTLGAVLVPLLIAFGVSMVRRPIYVVGRHDLIAWGAYYVLAGAVLVRLPRPAAAAAVLVWVALAAATLGPYFRTDRPRRNYSANGDSIARALSERARAGELVVFTASTRTMTEYYLRREPNRLRLVSYPLDVDEHLGWVDPRIRTDAEFQSSAAEQFARWLAAAGPLATVWVVAPQSRGTPQLLGELQRLGYREDRARSAGVLLCLRRE